VRIGIDLDGCAYEWERTARYMLREILPNSPYKETLRGESQGWNWIQERVLPGHWAWLWKQGVELGLFRHGHVSTGAIQGIRELATLGDVIVVTHRPKQAVVDTLAWLAYQQLPLTGVHLLTAEENKGLVRPGFDVFLDDKPQNIIDVRDNSTAFTYIMRRPWNEGISVPGDEVRNWAEFVGKVRDLSSVQSG
jgi:5'(3')-deoxyribonucleotidase